MIATPRILELDDGGFCTYFVQCSIILSDHRNARGNRFIRPGSCYIDLKRIAKTWYL